MAQPPDELLRLIFEEASDGIFVVDAEGRVQEANPSACALLGRSRRELSQLTLAELIHPDDLATTPVAALGPGERRQIRRRLCHSDGTFVPCEVSVTRLSTGGYLGVLRDLRSREETEHATRRLASVLSVLTEGVVIHGPDGAITFANQSASALLGLTPDQLMGRDSVDPRWRAVREDGGDFPGDEHPAMVSLRTGEEQQDVIMGLQTPADERRWLSINSRPLCSESGELTGAVVSFFDVTALKVAEDTLREQEARLSRALSGTTDGFYDVDLTTGEVHTSPRFVAIAGPAPKVHDPVAAWLARVHPDDRARVEASMQETLAGGQRHWDLEYRVIRPDETIVWLRERGGASAGADGEPTRIAGTISDITERLALEEQYRQAQKMEAVGRLAGGIAHDFNNILTVILGYAEIVRKTTDESGRGDIDQILSAGHRAADLTRQILAFSRKQVLVRHRVDVNAIARRVKALVERLIGEHITVRLVSDGPIFAHADETQLEQVLMNLCVNARDAMPEGGQLTIETRPLEIGTDDGELEAGPHVLLRVRDVGSGIHEEDLERIFEPFFTTKPAGKGTGLGLATAYGIAKQHGGTVRVASTVGAGATFDVLLPRSERGALKSRPATLPAVAGGSETILVAEDEPMLRRLIEHALSRAGYRTIVACDGVEAVERFDAYADEVDLLVLDAVMPRRSGRDALRRIQAKRPGVPFIVTSGYDTDVVERDPGERWLNKPFSIAKLLGAVRAALDSEPVGADSDPPRP